MNRYSPWETQSPWSIQMKLSRHGAEAFHGVSTIEFTAPSFGWYEPSSSLQICEARAKDFSTNAHHSYTAHITVAELNAVFRTLADAALRNPAEFEEAFAPSLKALLQLQSVVSGVRS